MANENDSISTTSDSIAPAKSGAIGFQTGAVMPKDMTVRLVRADSAIWEVFLSVFWSLTLTVFGVYLGAWITAANQKPTPLTVKTGSGVSASTNEITVDLAQSTFGPFEKFACVGFGLVSLTLVGAWALMKYRQTSNTLTVPYEILKQYGEDGSEKK